MMTTNHQVDISDIPILDIRQEQHSSSLLDSIHDELHPEENGAKRLPTLLLYDEPGLRLFEDVTYLEEYYLTNAEIEVLRIHADSIAKLVQTGSQMIELGSGYAPIFYSFPPIKVLTIVATSVRSVFCYTLSKKRGKMSSILPWIYRSRSLNELFCRLIQRSLYTSSFEGSMVHMMMALPG